MAERIVLGSIVADATDSGDGGTVIVWGENATQFEGEISATGANCSHTAQLLFEEVLATAGRTEDDVAGVLATGYGRSNVAAAEGTRTEIACHGRGAYHYFPRAITVVDIKSTDLGHNGVTAVQQDGVQWLAAKLQPMAPVDIVVPAIPVHVAYEWLKFNLSERYKIKPIAIPDEWLARMPNAMRGAVGQAYVSHADFICPDNCPEPETICTHTGKPRPMDLFRLLAGLDFDDVLPIVIRSHQLLPGVGGTGPR